MTTINGTGAGRWFRRVMWTGIAVNLALAIPTLLVPEAMLARNALPPATPDLWVRFSAVLLILLSVFYMPAGADPDRYRANTWLAIASRFAGTIFFFLFQPRAYWMLGLVDLVFLIPLAILMAAALRSATHSPALAPARERTT